MVLLLGISRVKEVLSTCHSAAAAPAPSLVNEKHLNGLHRNWPASSLGQGLCPATLDTLNLNPRRLPSATR